MKQKGSRIISLGITVLYSSAAAGIVCLLLLFAGRFDFAKKRIFDASNITLLLLGIGLFAVFFLIGEAGWSRFYKGKRIREGRVLLVLTLLLFLLQVYAGFQYYFKTGWDSRAVVNEASLVARGIYGKHDEYFSTYPNNLFLTAIYSGILKWNLLFGMADPKAELMVLITVNCLINSMSGLLTYCSVKRLTERTFTAVTAWILFVLLAGISPWIVIPYSDSFALFLPILVFYLYLLTKKQRGWKQILRWGILTACAFWGYKIKPQVLVIFIAILLVESVGLLLREQAVTRKEVKTFLACLVTGAVVVGVSQGIVQQMVHKTGIQINTERTFGIAHFWMMGLNGERGGVYSNDDVAFSGSFSTRAQRRAGNMEVGVGRLKEFGVAGYGKFLVKKTLTNFGDGTFAWSGEGEFYDEIYEDRNTFLSPLLKSFYFVNGKNHHIFMDIVQAVWLCVLFLLVWLPMKKNISVNPEIFVLMLTFLGVMAFVLLFEARARYLYHYVPIYVTSGVIGAENLILMIKKRLIRKNVDGKVDVTK